MCQVSGHIGCKYSTCLCSQHHYSCVFIEHEHEFLIHLPWHPEIRNSERCHIYKAAQDIDVPVTQFTLHSESLSITSLCTIMLAIAVPRTTFALNMFSDPVVVHARVIISLTMQLCRLAVTDCYFSNAVICQGCGGSVDPALPAEGGWGCRHIPLPTLCRGKYTVAVHTYLISETLTSNDN